MKNMTNTKKLIIAASISLFLILAVLFISFALPFLTAKDLLNKRIKFFEELPSGATLQINDPYNTDAGVLPTTVDVFLDGTEASALSQELCNAIKDAKYSGKDTNINGFWDVSVSIRTEGGISTVYLCEDEIYVTKDASKYSFKPTDKDLYYDLYEKAVKMLSEQANSTH